MTATTANAPEIASQRRSTRFWEIDAMRGVAIITMIVYHLMWDLFFTGVLPNINLWDGFWKYWQRFTCGTFLILVGVSLTLVYRRERARRGPNVSLFPKFFWRGLKIFGLGMLITLVVWFAFTQLGAEGFIDFGILHLIGISTILAYPLLQFKWLNFGLWVAFSIAGKLLENVHWDGAFSPLLGSLLGRPVWIDGRWLAPFGVMPTHYPAVDYFPLIPWFGVVLLGVWFGNWFYEGNTRRIALPEWGHVPFFRGLEFLGRHSLFIYMIHQPLLLAMLAMFGVIQF